MGDGIHEAQKTRRDMKLGRIFLGVRGALGGRGLGMLERLISGLGG